MDVFAHILWVAALFKALNQKYKLKYNLAWAGFWGVFPDLFAFIPLFAWRFYHRLVLGETIPFRGPIEPSATNALPIHSLTHGLYSLSHSAIIFFIVFVMVWKVWKYYGKPMPWVIGGWLAHILLDIPTHSYRFYPTPFLWPISEWKFNGISWATPWFMLVNYTALVAVCIILWKKK